MRAFAPPPSPSSPRAPQRAKDPEQQWRLAMNGATPSTPLVSTQEKADEQEYPSSASPGEFSDDDWYLEVVNA